MQSDAMDADEQQYGSSSAGRPKVVITTRHGREAAAAAGGSASSGAGRRVVKTKGRGFQSRYESTQQERYAGKGGEFESIEEESGAEVNAQKSIEGWIVVLTGLHEETNEDDLYELLADHGDVKQLHLNLDRRTGFVKGYCLAEFAAFAEAAAAIQAINGHVLHEKEITADWAFKLPPGRGGARRGGQRGAGARRER